MSIVNNKVSMKNVFVISALSLAIATVNGVQAESSKMVPEDCVVEGGQGESLAEWGMWCGVGSFLAALSEMAPTAAGPEGPGFDSGPGDPTGRGEADDFDPQATREDEPEEPVIPEDPVDEPVPPHIVTPEGEGEFVGYFASQDYSIEEDFGVDDANGAVFSNYQTGGFDLSVVDGGEYPGYEEPAVRDNGYGEPVDPNRVNYARYDKEGDSIDGNSFSSENDFRYVDKDGYGGSSQLTVVNLYEDESETSSFDASRGSYSLSNGDNPATREGENIFGSEVVAYKSDEGDSEGNGDSLMTSEPKETREVLKNYWAGYFGNFSSQDGRNGFSVMGRIGAFVAGDFTEWSEIQDMISGAVSAVYTGNSHQWGQSVKLTVDFDNRDFVGVFGDRTDFRRGLGGIDKDKDMSFTAEGVIEGVHLISKSVTADAGFVQGSFFGSEGRIVGGAYDITKQGDRVVDVFTAVKGVGNRVEVEVEVELPD